MAYKDKAAAKLAEKRTLSITQNTEENDRADSDNGNTSGLHPENWGSIPHRSTPGIYGYDENPVRLDSVLIPLWARGGFDGFTEISRYSMKEQDFYWLVGLLEGEGTFLAPPPSSPRTPIIAVVMTDLDIVSRVAGLFGVSYIHTRKHDKDKNWKDCFRVALKGVKAVDLMLRLHPHMGERRQSQINKALSGECMKPARGKKLHREKVDEIRALLGKKTQTQIAKEFGISRTTVRGIRDGRLYNSELVH